LVRANGARMDEGDTGSPMRTMDQSAVEPVEGPKRFLASNTYDCRNAMNHAVLLVIVHPILNT
jgi:hypothetical protein